MRPALEYDLLVQAFRRDKIIGAMLGGAIGDVLGGIAERGSLTFSDDTQLTLATCEAILERGHPSPDAIANRMLQWFLAGRVSGIGSSTLKAMHDLAGNVHWALAGARGERAAGNGAAMRIAPVAFWLNPDVQRDRGVIRDIARITHHNEEAYIGALAVVLAIRAAARGRLLGPAEIAADLPDSVVRDYLLRVAARVDARFEDVASEIGTSGYTPETVAVAVALASRMIERGIESAIFELNEFGGDTDTIGSIAGQIAGAALGSGNLPIHLLADVPLANKLVEIAEQFAATAA